MHYYTVHRLVKPQCVNVLHCSDTELLGSAFIDILLVKSLFSNEGYNWNLFLMFHRNYKF